MFSLAGPLPVTISRINRLIVILVTCCKESSNREPEAFSSGSIATCAMNVGHFDGIKLKLP